MTCRRLTPTTRTAAGYSTKRASSSTVSIGRNQSRWVGPARAVRHQSTCAQVRVDGQGLVTGLALSSMLGGQLETIAEDHTIRYRSGSLLTYCRGMPGLSRWEKR